MPHTQWCGSCRRCSVFRRRMRDSLSRVRDITSSAGKRCASLLHNLHRPPSEPRISNHTGGTATYGRTLPTAMIRTRGPADVAFVPATWSWTAYALSRSVIATALPAGPSGMAHTVLTHLANGAVTIATTLGASAITAVLTGRTRRDADARTGMAGETLVGIAGSRETD